MKITFVTGGRGKVTVFADGERIAPVDEEFALSCGYKDGDEIDGAQLAAFLEAVRLRSAFLGAMRILSGRDHGKKELENKLVSKGHSRESASKTCDLLEEKGYLDDSAYALSLAKRLYESRGFSSRRIKSELLQQGISRENADYACENIDIEPVSRIIELLNTKFRNKLGTEKGNKQVFSALLRMGYSYSDIRSAMNQADISIGED